LEVGLIRRIQVLDTAYWGFLGIGNTFDIFQNIILIPYLEYDILSPLDTTYRIFTKGQKSRQTGQNRARNRKEHEKTKPKANTSLMGQPVPILKARSAH
ncbi:hypothetical protein Tco_0129901, partial [Tanacetum coccineum]